MHEQKEAGRSEFDFLGLPDDAPVYERIADIPIEEGKQRFFFNGGHSRNQLLPYVPELVEKYGAVAQKVKKVGRAGYEVHIGIEPEQLFLWLTTCLNKNEPEDATLDHWLLTTGAMIGDTEDSVSDEVVEHEVSQRVNVQALYNVIFGFRQQLGQYFKIEDQLDVAQQTFEIGQYQNAQKVLNMVEKTMDGLGRQNLAAEKVFTLLRNHLHIPKNYRRFFAIPELVFEYDTALVMLNAALDNMREETFHRVRLHELRQQVEAGIASSAEQNQN